MQVKFSEVGVNERFTFVFWQNHYFIKISPRKHTDCTTGQTFSVESVNTLCNVDNTCTCDYPRPLTFHDLSIGSIFQFGLVYRLWEKETILYIKLDNMHYRRLSNNREVHILDEYRTVCTVYNMQIAQ